MTAKPPLPGRHNHIEGAPPESFRYVAEMGEGEELKCDSCECGGELSLMSDTDHRIVCEDYPSCGGILPELQMEPPTEPVGVPSKLGRALADPMTDEEMDALGERQSRSLREFFDREARTVTVRIYYKGPGNPHAAVASALKQWSPKVFETEILDA